MWPALERRQLALIREPVHSYISQACSSGHSAEGPEIKALSAS